MTFEELLDQAIALLQRRGRLTYRALKRQFNVDDDYLEDLKAELIQGQRLAVDEDGEVLVWTGGTASAIAPAATPTPVPAQAPLTYTPPHLAEKILAARPALAGERKQVTVFFADMKDSTRLIEGLDPEAAQQLLDPAIQLMMDAVHRFEGTVNQVLGDGMMALFGAPIAHEDHALRACYAALAVQHAIRTYAEAVRRTHGMLLQLRVGLNAGEVVVRAIGNDLHTDYSAVGQHTHLAARMEQLAAPGSILLSAGVLRLVERLPTAHLLLLVNYRPEYQHGWGSKTYYTQLRLDPLAPASAAAVLQALLGTDPSLVSLRQLLIERTEGNPFFLEESVRTLVEIGVLVGAPGAYVFVKPLDSLQVPATVQAVLAARIDRLPAEAKRLLQTAAVIGTEVPLPLLQAIADMPEAVLHRGLAHLQAAEFLYETRLFPESEYTFKHALTHEVAYGSLLLERRRGLHARLVEALEALAPERAAEQVERLAHHAVRGEVWAKAVPYCQQAGARAWDRAAFREAVAYNEQALQALGHLPEHGDTRVLAIELRLALGRQLNALGEQRRRLALLGEAEARARALDDRARLGRVLAGMTNARRVAGDLDGAIAAGQEALGLAAALGDSALQVEAAHRLGQAYYAIGDFGRAAELLWRNVEAADRESRTPSTDSLIESRAWLAQTLSSLGAFAEGRRHGEEALRLATLEGRAATPIVAHGCLGFLYLAQGDLEHAIRVFDQGLALCRASGYRPWVQSILVGLGSAAVLQGRMAEGRALVEEAINEDIPMRGPGGRIAQLLSEAYRLAGRDEEAWQHARQALDQARQHKDRASEAEALYQLGVLHAHADPPDAVQAEAHYQQALALAEELGMRPLQAHCHLGLGTLFAKIGRLEHARAELFTAIDLYRAMDMTFWLPQAEAALAEVEGL